MWTLKCRAKLLHIHQQGAGAQGLMAEVMVQQAAQCGLQQGRSRAGSAQASPLPCSSAAFEAGSACRRRSPLSWLASPGHRRLTADNDWGSSARCVAVTTLRSGNRPSSASSRNSKRAAPRVSSRYAKAANACPRRRRRADRGAVVPGEQLHQQLVQVVAREQAGPPGRVPPAIRHRAGSAPRRPRSAWAWEADLDALQRQQDGAQLQ